jgi:hypothetical protein
MRRRREADPRRVSALCSFVRNAGDRRLTPNLPENTVLTRWVVIGELLLPNPAKSPAIVSSDAAGSDLQSWDLQGLYVAALRRTMRPGG